MSHRLDTMISKGAGKVKGVKARLEGLVGVFNTLAEQHAEVKVLLKRLQGSPERRPELWPEIRRELLSHERAEVREVYSALRDQVQTRQFAEHHDQEVAELEAMIQDLDDAKADWREQYDDLVDAVIHHAEEEEKEIFPKALKAIGEAKARELDHPFRLSHKHAASTI